MFALVGYGATIAIIMIYVIANYGFSHERLENPLRLVSVVVYTDTHTTIFGLHANEHTHLCMLCIYTVPHTHTHSLNHFVHSLTASLPHSITHPPIHSFTHSLTASLPPSLTHSLTHSLPHSITHSLPHSLTQSLTHPPTHSQLPALSQVRLVLVVIMGPINILLSSVISYKMGFFIFTTVGSNTTLIS